MWLNRRHSDVIFGDMRCETVTVTDRSHGNAAGTRILSIEPDVLLDFCVLPYPDGTFHLVVFDPPHLIRAGPKSWLSAKYGKLGDDWRSNLHKGFSECFRVLAAHGVLVFKWNETQVRLNEVLPLAKNKPLFGHTSGYKGLTHWLVFMQSERHENQPSTKGIVMCNILTKSKLIYISGPMTGLLDFNFPAFHAAAAQLRAQGWLVENPAETPAPQPGEWLDYMRRAIPQLMRCDTVVLLPGWGKSRGARIECQLALGLGLNVLFWDTKNGLPSAGGDAS